MPGPESQTKQINERREECDDHPSQQKTSRLPYLSIPHAPFGIDSSK